MATSRQKRPKAPPPRLDLEEMEQDPSMRGMLSFLEISPAEKLEMLRRRTEVDRLENTKSATVAADLTTPVSVYLPDTASLEPSVTAAVDPAMTVTAGASATDIEAPEATVAGKGLPPVPASLWYAEGNAGVFPPSRVRRITAALDVLTHTELTVYEILWGSGAPDDRERLSSTGYDVLARQAGVTKMNAKHILERLIDKGFLQVERLPDTLRRIPTRYRVFSQASALERMARRNRSHVVRAGNGILFAHLLPVTVAVETPATVRAVPAETD